MDLPPNFPVVETLDDDTVATTYLARDTTARDAVLTVAKAPVAAEDRAAYLRWADALGTAAAHPHVADVLAAGLTPDGRPYVVSRTGQVLADRLSTGALDPLTVRVCGVGLAAALAAAHDAGLTHGTVQPATVLLDDTHAVLAGFSALAPGLTLPFAVGEYTPPEHMPTAAVGRAAASEAGDVYGLGVTLHVMLGGVPPWAGESMNLALRAVPLPAPPHVPDALFDVVRAAASVDPAARPTAAQLRDWLAGLELAAEPGVAVPVPAGLLTGQGARVVGRRTMVLIAGAGGAAGITGGVLASGGFGGGTGSGAGGTAAGGGTGDVVGGTAAMGATVAAVPAAAVGGATGVISTAAAGVTVTKVVVITVAVAAVGVGGGYTATEILGADCDEVAADRPAREVLVDAAHLLGKTSFEFDLALGRMTAEGAVDPAEEAGRFTVRPAEQGGEGRLVDGQLYVTGPIASTAAGEWTVVAPGSTAGYAMAADLPSVAASLLGTADPVERDGCDFEGRLHDGSMPFEATIEDGTGRLTRVAFSAGEGGDLAGLGIGGEQVEATFGGFGTEVAVPAPVTSTSPTEPVSAGLAGRWVGIHGDVQVVIASGVVGVLFQGRELCAAETDMAGPVLTVRLGCVEDGTYVEVVANLELDGADRLVVSGAGIVAGVSLDGVYQRVP